MGVYHQLGDKSANLLKDQRLSYFKGAILSPVNYPQREIAAQINEHQGFGYRLIFDPQLYFPKSARGNLPSWSHYPKDVDTADMASDAWWTERVTTLAGVARQLGLQYVCSPATAPRVFSSDYYSRMIDVAEELREALSQDHIEVLPTVIANLRDHSDSRKVNETASIVSRSNADRVYLVFSTETDPRRELGQWEDIAGGMRLIRLLEEAGIKVLLGFTSSDVILWKAAGATDCASGKFFNLRRFTPSRWDPPARGGGQIEYWFEESLLAFLREPDVLVAQAHGLISPQSANNPYCNSILDGLGEAGKAWLGESWRQYLYWFQDVEKRLRENTANIDDLLNTAAESWRRVREANIYFDENANDGQWIARWQTAVNAFRNS